MQILFAYILMCPIGTRMMCSSMQQHLCAFPKCTWAFLVINCTIKRPTFLSSMENFEGLISGNGKRNRWVQIILSNLNMTIDVQRCSARPKFHELLILYHTVEYWIITTNTRSIFLIIFFGMTYCIKFWITS